MRRMGNIYYSDYLIVGMDYRTEISINKIKEIDKPFNILFGDDINEIKCSELILIDIEIMSNDELYEVYKLNCASKATVKYMVGDYYNKLYKIKDGNPPFHIAKHHFINNADKIADKIYNELLAKMV